MAKKFDEAETKVSDASSVPTEVFKKDPDPVAVLASTVGEKVYEWPLEKADNIDDALELARNFLKQNLKDGQKFSLNWQKGTMFFLPECKISLNLDNPIWVYREKDKLGTEALGYLFFAIRAGSIIPGDYGVKQVIPTIAPSTYDCKVIDRMSETQVRDELRKILSKKTMVHQDGTIISSGADIEALIVYEKANKNRRPVLDLLFEAQKKSQGSVAFLGVDEIRKEEERKKMESRASAARQDANRAKPRVEVGVSTAGAGPTVSNLL